MADGNQRDRSRQNNPLHRVYYNEIDAYCAEWLRNLMDAGHIPAGDIDTRSIEDVRPDELRGYAQCHFFAGLGGWAYALQLAGWGTRPVWTGSCPCQPFSAAGKGAGFADERHLWPAFHHLIRERRPTVVFGEQVASKDADAWIDLVHADLENVDYAFGCVPFPAAGIRAPHIRDRNYWVADVCSSRLEERVGDGRIQREALGARSRETSIGSGDPFGLADAHGGHASAEREQCSGQPKDGFTGGLGHAYVAASERRTGSFSGEKTTVHRERIIHGREHHRSTDASKSLGEWPSPLDGFWRDADWLLCTDGRWRPVEPGTFPLAHGISARMGRLRAYGNAIVAPQAKEFIGAYMQERGLKPEWEAA